MDDGINTDISNAQRLQIVGITQQSILQALRRQGDGTLAGLASQLSLAVPTVREHMNVLLAKGFVREAGRRSDRPGRPSTVYVLTPQGEDLFPLVEGRILRDLATYLIEQGQEEALEAFFDQRAEHTRTDLEKRLEGLTGRQRLEAVANIMTERGFMAEVTEDTPDGKPTIRLCNCPLRHIVSATKIPCRAEIGMLHQLLGRGVLRNDYMPDGDSACSYTVELAARGND